MILPLVVGCDNQQTGWTSNILDVTISSSVNHFDLVKVIRRLHYSIEKNVQCYHIYGHQDKTYTIPHVTSGCTIEYFGGRGSLRIF